MQIRVQVRRVGSVDVPMPERKSAEAAGFDLAAAIEAPIAIPPGERHLVPTGFAIAIPSGYEGQVRPRSGLALKHGITVLNSPGTIDADYRGEVKVVLINLGKEAFVLHPKDRIAQIVFAPVTAFAISEVTELDPTERGAGGYGSTGKA